MSFLRVTLDLFEVDKLIKAGDVDMLTIELKRLIPTFIGLSSYRSKYAIECVNFLTKSEILLSEKESVRLKLQAFVNVNGDKGENKAADMQQEIHIKSVKSTLRSLGAGKSDVSITRSSKASPVVSNISENTFDMMRICPKKQKHTKKSSDTDMNVLLNHLRTLKPFEINTNRNLQNFSGINSNIFDEMDMYKVKDFTKRHCNKAISKIALDSDDDDTDDEDIDQ